MLKDTQLPSMKTHCVGRFLVDLPEDFEQSPGSDLELVYGLGKDFRRVKVEIASGANASLKRLVAKRITELTSQPLVAAPSGTMLAVQKAVSDHAVLIRSYDVPGKFDYFKSELFVEFGPVVGLFSDDVFANDRPEKIDADLVRIANRATLRDAAGPTGEGACFGPLIVNAGQDGESLTIGFNSIRTPDVRFAIDMNTMLAESDGGLLRRWDRKASILAKLNFKSDTLRRGNISLGGMAGEELLYKGNEQGRVLRKFSAETVLSKPATFRSPSLAISMTTGRQLDAGDAPAGDKDSMSDQHAIALWDAMIKSVRLRPGADRH